MIVRKIDVRSERCSRGRVGVLPVPTGNPLTNPSERMTVRGTENLRTLDNVTTRSDDKDSAILEYVTWVTR